MYKGKLVNIEWSPDNNYNFTEETFSEAKKGWMKQEVKIAVEEGYDTIVAICLIDGLLNPSPEFFPAESIAMKEECNKLGIKKLIFVSGHGGTIFPKELAFDKILFTDYTLRFTYNTYKDKIENDLLPKYKPVGRYLFLGGVPSRLNRIGLAYKLYQNNLLKDETAIWTFFKPWNADEEEKCRVFLPDVDELDYKDFLKYAERRVDDLFENSKHFFSDWAEVDGFWHDVVNHEWAKHPALIDSNIFDNTSLSVISEGPNYWVYSDNYDFVTEKFWRSVFHRHPFLFAGDVGQYLYMKKLGFKTFEEYFKIPNYYLLDNEHDRIDAIVENVKDFLVNEHQYADAIEKDVEYNYKLAVKYAHEQEDFIQNLKKEYSLPNDQVEYYFYQRGYSNLIIKPPLYLTVKPET